MPKLLFVDDHHVLLDALRSFFSNQFQVRTTNSLQGIDDMVHQFQPHLLVLDLRIPEADTVALARRLTSEHSHLKVMFLSMYSEPRDVKRAMDAGASAFVSKRTSAADLLVAIRTVLNGGRYVSPENHVPDASPETDIPLTDRQKEVLRLIALGFSAKQVASQLNISIRTAEFHRAAIMDRLKLSSSALLTRYALERGIA